MSEPIRVAHIVGKMVGGGVEAVVMNYYRHIDRSQVQFDFIIDSDSTVVPEDEIRDLGGVYLRFRPISISESIRNLSVSCSNIINGALSTVTSIRFRYFRFASPRRLVFLCALPIAMRPWARVKPGATS